MAATIEAMKQVTLIDKESGEPLGDYNVVERGGDGSLVIAPDTSAEAIRERLGTRALSAEEFEEHFGDLPTDGEG